jgi:hypothetical protein
LKAPQSRLGSKAREAREDRVMMDLNASDVLFPHHSTQLERDAWV